MTITTLGPEETLTTRSPLSLTIGAQLAVGGVTYIVTKTGVERLTGDRKERRARVAGLRKAGLV